MIFFKDNLLDIVFGEFLQCHKNVKLKRIFIKIFQNFKCFKLNDFYELRNQRFLV
jgi:hypothetical protein